MSATILSVKKDLVRCYHCGCVFTTVHMQNAKKARLGLYNQVFNEAYTCPVCRYYIAVREAKPLKTEYENKNDIEKILSEVFSDFSREAISKIADVAFKEQPHVKEG